MMVCADCGSKKVYSIEFRTDYACARSLYPVNDTEELTNDDLPKYLSGYYCAHCQTFCSIREPEIGKPKNVACFGRGE